jgi:hypothetical protein
MIFGGSIMTKTYLYTIPSIFIMSLFGPFVQAQQLDPQDIAYNELRQIVESASRANARVWLEDFTGIN